MSDPSEKAIGLRDSFANALIEFERTAHAPAIADEVSKADDALMDYVAALEAVRDAALLLENDFGGWWLSSPADEPLGRVRDALAKVPS